MLWSFHSNFGSIMAYMAPTLHIWLSVERVDARALPRIEFVHAILS